MSRAARLPLLILLSLLLPSLLPLSVRAASRDELKRTEAAIEEARTKQKTLAEAEEKARRELEEMRQALAAAAAGLRDAEQELADIEEKLVILQSQLDEKSLLLDKRRGEIGVMLAAALRLSATPPEAALMMPGDFLRTLQSARAVETVRETLKRDAEDLRRQLTELRHLRRRIDRHRGEAERRREALALRQAALRRDIDLRQSLVEKLATDRSAQQENLKKLAARASSLKELLASIRRDAGRENATPMARQLRSFAKARGRLRPPAAGRLLRAFGVALTRNDTTKGLTFRTPAGVSVIAPYDGEVVYTGRFLNYGKLVILRHSDEFHTLLAGMERIDVAPGQFLLEGEPIGGMSSKKSGTKLYFELRERNQPIDPLPWIKN